MIEYAKGIGGAIEVYKNKIVIRRKGFSSFIFHGIKGDKEIFINQISAIQFKKAGLFLDGYIQFSFLGGNESTKSYFEGINDENTVLFTKKQQKDFERAKEIIEELISNKNYDGSNNYSFEDGIKELYTLLDEGVITKSEFEELKKKYLG